MNLIIASKADSASINLRNRLLEMSKWDKYGTYENEIMWSISKDYGEFCKKGTRLITIEELHIYAEEIDKIWERQNNLKIDHLS